MAYLLIYHHPMRDLLMLFYANCQIQLLSPSISRGSAGKHEVSTSYDYVFLYKIHGQGSIG